MRFCDFYIHMDELRPELPKPHFISIEKIKVEGKSSIKKSYLEKWRENNDFILFAVSQMFIYKIRKIVHA